MIISEAKSCVNDNTNQPRNQEKPGYVYRHIRLDTNMPFYIGISTVNNGKYTRAYTKSSRSKEWHGIIDNCEYEVEILLKDVPISILGDKEKYFIKLYGRVDLGTGTLVNKNSGGKGNCGYKHTEESKKIMSIANKGKIISDEQKKKASEFHKGNKHNLGRKHTEEERKKRSVSLLGNQNGLGYKHTEQARKNMSKAQKGKIVSVETIKKMRINSQCRPVGQYDSDGNLIKEYPSLNSTRLDGFTSQNIGKCCNNKYGFKTHKGFQWKYL